MLYLIVELPSIWLLELAKASEVQVASNETAVLGSLYTVTKLTPFSF